jgi:putative thioredoxin
MSQHRPPPALRGAVDLSALRRPPRAAEPPQPPQAAGPAPAAGPAQAAGPAPAGTGQGEPSAPERGSGEVPVVHDVTDATFASYVELSRRVPVVVDLWATWCAPCRQLSPILEKLAHEYAGRFVLAKVDVDANPQISAAFQVQSIPSVMAVVAGQPVPLFQGAYPEAQVRAVIEELLTVAAQNGVAGLYEGEETLAEGEPAEPPLPPLHQAAYDALENDDLDGAARAFGQAVRENPRDDDARAGLAQVELLRRLVAVDPSALLAAGARAPAADVEAHLAAADVEVASGHAPEAFDRLIRTVRATAGPERERVRVRLLELFEVVGTTTPEVGAARRRLAMALY